MGTLHDLSGYSREDVVVEFAELAKKNLRTPMPAVDGTKCRAHSLGEGGAGAGESGRARGDGGGYSGRQMTRSISGSWASYFLRLARKWRAMRSNSVACPPAVWGVMMQLGRFHSGLSGGSGSGVVTSR